MEIRPTPDQEAFIRAAIDTGRIASPEDAAKEGLALWEERERRRHEILAACEAAEASIERGEGTEITAENMRKLADDVKRRGRERLAAEQLPR